MAKTTKRASGVIKMACLSKMGKFPTLFEGQKVEVKHVPLDAVQTVGKWIKDGPKATLEPPASSLIEISGEGAEALAASYRKKRQAVDYP